MIKQDGKLSMKNMVLLIDTNVVMDYLFMRKPRYGSSDAIITICKTGIVKAYIAFHTMPNLWYMLNKAKIDDTECRNLLLDITTYLTVAATSHDDVVSALHNRNFPDFEDCLQEKCALAVNADYIVTENVKDFTTSKVPAVTAREMLKILYDTEGETLC